MLVLSAPGDSLDHDNSSEDEGRNDPDDVGNVLLAIAARSVGGHGRGA